MTASPPSCLRRLAVSALGGRDLRQIAGYDPGDAALQREAPTIEIADVT